MKQVLQNLGKGRIFVEEVPPSKPGAAEVLVRNAFSILSPGTERAKVEVGRKSLLGKAMERPDQVRQVLQKIRQEGLLSTWRKVKDRLSAPAPLGYSSSGIVIETGREVSGLRVGDRVACAGNQCAYHAEIIAVPVNLCAKVPESVTLPEAATATLGAIALHGVRQSGATLGENVAVIGLGLIGQLTVQILKASGCRVFGIDLEQKKVDLAKTLGMEEGGIWGSAGLLERVQSFSGGLGTDVIVLTAATESAEPILFAAQCARDRARIAVVGQVPVNLPRSPFYEKELSIVSSRSYGPGRYDPLYEESGVDYPVGYIRWTEGRNLSAYLNLLAQGSVKVSSLLTHRFTLEEAPRAFEKIASHGKELTLGILIEYARCQDVEPLTPKIQKRLPPQAGRLGIGMIGAGHFGASTILPVLKGMKELDLRILCTQHGHTGKYLARKFGFFESTCDPESVFEDASVKAVVICTRHDTHGSFVRAALEKGKTVFVEKPLCLEPEELEAIVKVQNVSQVPVFVGFNRRFSRLTQQMCAHLQNLPGPRLITYRVNAGALPAGHWLNDSRVGGGRIRGEVCHFIDLAVHLAGGAPVRLFAQSPGGSTSEDISIQISFRNGSLAHILYTARGHAGIGKERLEVFAGRHAMVIDDFKTLSIHGPSVKKRLKTWVPDKGHRREIEQWVHSLANGTPSPIPFEEAVLSTQLTFLALDSLEKGSPVTIFAEPHEMKPPDDISPNLQGA
jgi:predicted dehydrogenase/threonine dehydrogenase-like Zn-dependent dehydrogenase